LPVAPGTCEQSTTVADTSKVAVPVPPSPSVTVTTTV